MTIFEAGATEQGEPYLVMEYVDGCPIIEYCNRLALAIARRLKLFQQVCDGVQYGEAAVLTEIGMLIGTVGYMSPEQSGLTKTKIPTLYYKV